MSRDLSPLLFPLFVQGVGPELPGIHDLCKVLPGYLITFEL